jgi:phosphatidate cytidylyltransferase
LSFRSNLALRLATAAVAIPALLAAFFLGPPALGLALIALAAALGLVEYFRLLAARELEPFATTGSLLAAALFVEPLRPEALPPLWPAAALLLLIAVLRRAQDLARAVPAAAATLLGAVYLGALAGTLAGLVAIEPRAEAPWRVVLLLGIIMASDTAAFFLGHAIGRRRLAPSLSPGKTVEGALGGLGGGIAGALAVRAIGLPSLAPLDAVALGALAAACGIAGDLFESLLKRWAGVKDSGALFPGHGGMLDRMDSLLFAAPVLYYYFLFAR